MSALPDVLIVPDGECDRTLLTLVAPEAQRDGNGQQAFLDRLL